MVRVGHLIFLECFPPSPCVTCHISNVTCLQGAALALVILKYLSVLGFGRLVVNDSSSIFVWDFILTLSPASTLGLETSILISTSFNSVLPCSLAQSLYVPNITLSVVYCGSDLLFSWLGTLVVMWLQCTPFQFGFVCDNFYLFGGIQYNIIQIVSSAFYYMILGWLYFYLLSCVSYKYGFFWFSLSENYIHHSQRLD